MIPDSKAPAVELYMYSLNQEFPVGKGHQTYLKRSAELSKDMSGGLIERLQLESQVFGTDPAASPMPADWSVKWIDNQWIENHTKAAGVGRRPDLDPLRTSIMREEEFGAIVLEPQSDRVYKLNHAGAALFKLLQEEHSRNDGQISVKVYGDFDSETVGGFIGQLRLAGLWRLE